MTTSDAKGRKPPKAARLYMSEFDQTAEELRDYVLKQYEFYKGIGDPAVDFEGWLAFKIGASIPQARSVIKWAMN